MLILLHIMSPNKSLLLNQGDADEHSLSSASEQEQTKKTGKASNTNEKVQNPVEKWVL